MRKSLRGFFQKNPWKKETLLAYYYSAKFRMEIWLLPAGRMKKTWGREDRESAETESVESYRQATRISRIVNKVCDKTPWESKCLVRALTAQRLLYRRGLPSTLYLGCGMEDGKMVAHAWLRCGEFYVTGGDGSGYTTVARFYREGENHVGNLGNRRSVSRPDRRAKTEPHRKASGRGTADAAVL